ncbi:protein artichoke [Copidosoma floridanum]|uniref:protein artichoke n=1 Tax=Copidosoma floridanum TaxID=29053 RepID=UPI0006C99898|nr:protein artichoke [Copidosoma floridanum]
MNRRPRCCSGALVVVVALLAPLLVPARAQTAECPPSELIPGCPCYNFEDGLFLECAGATEDTLRSTMLGIVSAAGEHALVQSLSVYELDKGIEVLRESLFPVGSRIRHLQVSHSSLREVSETAFRSLRSSLESLALVSGRLVQVPQRALAELDGLAALDLEANLVQELASYCFYGLKLVKLSLKANRIAKVSEYAFAGLEPYLAELDLAENRLKHFPMPALRRLESLDSLKLAWNEIAELPDDGHSALASLLVLDLSSNNFERLGPDCFRPCPLLQSLSLYYNGIEDVDRETFVSLTELESLDLSHNKIVFLDAATFRANRRLRTVELSHNHIHYIGGVFAGLPELRELYLTENNVLELPAEAFAGSANLSVAYLQQNAIRRIDARGLAGLRELEQLHLTLNYIERLPAEVFEHCCARLSSLSLDGNRIRDLEPGTFARLGRLRELRLQDNRLAEVSRGVFAPLPGLQELHLQDNSIKDIESGAFSTLGSLQHVNLQGNQLTVLGDVFQPSSSSSALVSLQLDGNGLGVLHNDSLRGQASLKVMWLGHNKLTRLQAPLFRDLLQVERLYLTNNSISRIEDAAFRPMQALKFLELSQNRLTEIGVATFAELRELEELHLRDNGLRRIEPGALSALKRLRVLDLANNRLGVLEEAVFREALPVRRLNLRNCSIRSIEDGALGGLGELLELDLQDNQLDASALRRLRISGLQALTLSGNSFGGQGLADTSLHGLPSLQQLTLEGADLGQLPEGLFVLNVNLARLLLGRNGLRSLPPGLFDNLLGLREVRLERNRLAGLPYAALVGAKNLEILSLAHNEVVAVDVASLAGLRQLRELDLSYNLVESMSGFALANLSRLFSVDLSHNELHSLPANFFTNSPQLRRVDLSGNKFHQLPAAALSGRNLPGLAWLNFTANPLGRLHGEQQSPEATYPLLQEIHLEQVNLSILTSQEFEAFPGLQNLYLGRNGISRVSPGAFRSLPNLLTLHLGGNGLDILPQERLRGLEHLRILNLTRNRLKELEEFPEDLKALQMLDLSFNQIGAVGKLTFKNLVNLVELHLYGNWISAVSGEAFRPLKKLRLLDLSRNYLENLPLNAFRPLETQIRSLRAEENPLNCGCESQELWEWLRDHQKLVGSGSSRGRGRGVGLSSETEASALRCEQPPELRGLVFLDLDPHAFCSVPLVLKLAIQDIQPFSVLVSWQSRNHSGLHGYQVAYHALGNVDEVRGKLLEPKARSVRLARLAPDTRYLICVLGLGSWSAPPAEGIESPGLLASSWNSTEEDELLLEGSAHPVMVNSPMSRCTEVRTLEAPGSPLGEGPAAERGSLASILTRRLGLIVGSCMGFVVFVVLISVLGYMKMKKQRAALKREQPLAAAHPPDYLSYRHFSLQSGDNRPDNACPSFIT